MHQQPNIQFILNQKFSQYKLNNPQYSIRSLARKLEISPSATSEILKGKRRISLKMAKKIATKLMLSSKEKDYFLKEMSPSITVLKKNNPELIAHQSLKDKELAILSDRVHFALLTLLNTDLEISPDIKWLAHKLDTTEIKIQKALKNLFELSFVDLKNGKLVRLAKRFQTTNDIPSETIQEFYLKDLKLIKDKIHSDVPLRDYTVYTLPVDPELLPQAKNIIRKAQDEIDALMQTSKKTTEVYRLNTFFYPLSRPEKAYE